MLPSRTRLINPLWHNHKFLPVFPARSRVTYLEGARVAASRVIRDANRAAEIIDRVKLFFRKGVVTKEPLEFYEGIRREELLLHSEATQHSVSVQTKLAADLPLIAGDRVQLQQVLMNLMIDSIFAMKAVVAPRLRPWHPDTGEQLLGSPTIAYDNRLPIQSFFRPASRALWGSILRTIIEAHGAGLPDNRPAEQFRFRPRSSTTPCASHGSGFARRAIRCWVVGPPVGPPPGGPPLDPCCAKRGMSVSSSIPIIPEEQMVLVLFIDCPCVCQGWFSTFV